MVSLLTKAQFPLVRAALDSKLNDQLLPDNIISQDIYQAAAIQDVLDRDSSAESRTGTSLRRVRRAAVFFCAARLAPVVIRITALTIQARDMNYSKPAFDPAERAAELRQLAEDEIAAVLMPSETAPTMPTMFTRVTGTRGK